MTLETKTCPAATSKSPRATVDDIRRTFTDYRDELMWLALFLTGDEQLAEACVVDACALATTNNEVFHNWLLHWAQRATIRSAIEMKRPRIAELAPAYAQHVCTHRKHAALSGQATELLIMHSDVLQHRFDALCRFALVMRGLGDYSAQDCGLLLGISANCLEAAYCAALQSLESFNCELVRGLARLHSCVS